MSRAVKFRAWDKTSKRYVAVEAIDFDENGKVEFVHVDDFSHFHDHYILNRDDVALEQSTGFEDMNGKEVYEGDIMKFGIAGDKRFGVVDYSDRYGSYEIFDKNGFIVTGLFSAVGVVVGNIHENPELLGTDTSVGSKEKK